MRGREAQSCLRTCLWKSRRVSFGRRKWWKNLRKPIHEVTFIGLLIGRKGDMLLRHLLRRGIRMAAIPPWVWLLFMVGWRGCLLSSCNTSRRECCVLSAVNLACITCIMSLSLVFHNNQRYFFLRFLCRSIHVLRLSMRFHVLRLCIERGRWLVWRFLDAHFYLSSSFVVSEYVLRLHIKADCLAEGYFTVPSRCTFSPFFLFLRLTPRISRQFRFQIVFSASHHPGGILNLWASFAGGILNLEPLSPGRWHSAENNSG